MFTSLEEDIVNASTTMLLLHCERRQYDASVTLISAPLAFQKDEPSVIIKLNMPTCTDKLLTQSKAWYKARVKLPGFIGLLVTLWVPVRRWRCTRTISFYMIMIERSGPELLRLFHWAILKDRRGGKFAFEDPRSRRHTAACGHSRSPGSYKSRKRAENLDKELFCRRSRRMRINRLNGGCLESFCRLYSVVLIILCLALEIWASG